MWRCGVFGMRGTIDGGGDVAVVLFVAKVGWTNGVSWMCEGGGVGAAWGCERGGRVNLRMCEMVFARRPARNVCVMSGMAKPPWRVPAKRGWSWERGNRVVLATGLARTLATQRAIIVSYWRSLSLRSAAGAACSRYATVLVAVQ